MNVEWKQDVSSLRAKGVQQVCRLWKVDVSSKVNAPPQVPKAPPLSQGSKQEIKVVDDLLDGYLIGSNLL